MMKKYLHSDRLLGLGLILLAALLYWRTYWFAREVEGMRPQLFPRMLLISLGIFSLPLLFRKQATYPEAAVPIETKEVYGKIACVMGVLVLYVTALPLIGYLVSTLLYIGFMIWFLGERRLWRICIWSVGVTFVVYGIFDWFLNVELPSWWFV